MSGTAFTFNISTTLPQIDAQLAQFVAGLGNRVALHTAIAQAELVLVRGHLGMIAEQRHTTAIALGAKPTGHWARGAEMTRALFNATEAGVVVKNPGITRVDHDVTIKPGAGKQFLTLPVRAEAYGQRYGSVKGLIQSARASGDKKPWYAFVREVHQPQDRSLLPSDRELTETAIEAIEDYADALYAAAKQAGGAA